MAKAKPSARDVIASMERADIGAVSSGDFFSVMGSTHVPIPPPSVMTVSVPMTKEIAEDAVQLLLGIDRTSFDSEEAKVVLELVPGARGVVDIITHPAFILAAANKGVCFVPGKKIERHKLDKPAAKLTIKKKDVDPHFYLKPPWYDDLQDLIVRGEPVLLIGPAGVGKTEAVERIFESRGQKLMIVQCTPRTTANDLEGATDLVIEDGHQITRFSPAAPAVASEEGYGLLLDEADAAPSVAMYAMYRLMDAKAMHIVRKGLDAKIPFNPEFRIVGTQNTEGRGDDRGLYHGRAYQDEAFLDRWRNTIRVDYPTMDEEVLILRKRTGISGSQAESIVKSAQSMRSALHKDEILLTCTLRRTLSVSANVAIGMTPEKAWGLAVLNRATSEDRSSLDQILQRIYGSKFTKVPK